MLLMVEKGIWRGISHAIHRYAKVNNKYTFLLDIQCTTFYIEYRGVKRVNSHCTICSLFTLTHIIF